jgi:hypothetical protein
VKDGRVASTRILNEPAVYRGLAGRGFKAEADMVRQYLDDVMPKTRGRPTGAYVTQQEVLEHMTRKGADPARVEHFWREMVQVADPHIVKLADEMAVYGAQRVGNVGLGGEVLRTARENLKQPELEVLLELMNPILSAAETSVAVGKSLRRTESFASLAKLAEQQGLILDSATSAGINAPGWWRRVPLDQQAALPHLAGKVVHPTVYREFVNAGRLGARNERGLYAGLQQLRSLISGGYLANPATTTANVAGGFWTAAMYGINPTKLMGNMMEVYKDWKRLGRELPELVHMRDIVSAGVSQVDLIRYADDLTVAGGMGLREGMSFLGKAWHDATRRYGEFLRRPLGSRQSGVLGLGAFEASEALFRLGAFRMVMKETGGNVDKARQMARFVVFDYAAQPGVVQMARDSGVFMFPAFPYFMVGRTLTAATQRPGVLAAAERLPEAIGKLVVPDEGDRRRMLMGMEDWMIDDKFIPVRQRANGDVTMLSLNQLMPTNTMTGAPFADSLKSLGLWGPTLDIIGALTGLNKPYGSEDPGRGGFTGDFGRRVLPSGTRDWTDPGAVVGGVMSFIHNSFAPGFARKLVRSPEDIDQEWSGLAPRLVQETMTPAPAEWAGMGRSARELTTRRVDQDLLDAALSMTIRSTRNVATRGPLADGPRILERATRDFQSQLNSLDRRISLMAAEGNEAAIRDAMALRERTVQRFMYRWGDYIRELRTMAVEGAFQRPN